MERKLSLWLVDKLYRKATISNEYREVYIYGLELIFSFIISTSIIMTIGIALRQVIPTITFLITFIVIRQYTGGYHATTYFVCKLCTVSCFLISVLLARIVTVSKSAFIVLLILGAVIICLWGPIENPHKPLTPQAKKKHKITGLVLYSIWSIIGYQTSYIITSVSNTIFFTLCIIIILMIIPIFERRNKHEKAR